MKPQTYFPTLSRKPLLMNPGPALNSTLLLSDTSNFSSRLKIKTMLVPQIKLFTTIFRLLMTLKEKALENIVGKGENAGYQHFLLSHINVFRERN